MPEKTHTVRCSFKYSVVLAMPNRLTTVHSADMLRQGLTTDYTYFCIVFVLLYF